MSEDWLHILEPVLLGGALGAVGQVLHTLVSTAQIHSKSYARGDSSSALFASRRFFVFLLIGFLGGATASLVIMGTNGVTNLALSHAAFALGAVAAGYVTVDIINKLVTWFPPSEHYTKSGPRWSEEDVSQNINLGLDDGTLGPEEPQHDERSVGMFFATTRADAPLLSEGWFTGERGDRIAFGKAFVRVPESHRLGKIELPMRIRLLSLNLYTQTRDPTKHFVVRSVDTVPMEEWEVMIRSFPSDTALVFVHGYNTSFEEGLYRNAQIVWDLQFRGVSVMFSWPSRGHTLDYTYDRDSALGARKAFVMVLKRLKAQPNIKNIHILAHSMGNLVVLDALAAHWQDIASLQLGELMMAAPDIDRDLFEDIAPTVRKVTAGMTLYVSSADKALIASRILAGGIPRAGDVPSKGPVLLPQIETIDATAIGDDPLGFNHTVFAQSRSILNDVGILIQTSRRPPPDRLKEIRGIPEGAATPNYWRYSE